MLVTPASARHTVEDLGDGLKIIVPSQKQWFSLIFSAIWLIPWLFGLLAVSSILFTARGFGGFNWFLILWLCGWTLGGGSVAYTVLWQLAGREIIVATSQSLMISSVVFGFGTPREYAISHIQDLRVTPREAPVDLFGRSRSNYFWGRSEGVIAFDYGAKTYRFGSGIDEAEAKQVVSVIKRAFPGYGVR